VAAVADVLDRVRENPGLYPVVNGSARKATTRRFPYAVLYDLAGDQIRVLGVMHGRRHPRRIRDRLS
jgi:toxin ParE1/3/4